MSSRVQRPAVLRHTLFLPSEQFIPGQAQHLPMHVTYLARDEIVNAPVGADARAFAPTRSEVMRYMAGETSSLRRVLSDAGTDLLHAHFGVEGESTWKAAARLGIPHVTTLHGYDATLTDRALLLSKKPAWLRYAARRRPFLSNTETMFICVSEHIRGQAEKFGLDPSRAVVIPTGVDVTSLKQTPIPGDGVILHVARLVEKKGTAILLRAFEDLVRGYPSATLRIVGDGPLRAELEAQAEQLGVAKSVAFLGTKSHREVLDEMSACDILCLPSVTASTGDQEGLGQVLLEAGALGRPVVGTDHGGIREAVVHGRTGLLVPERDAGALADALGELLGASKTAVSYGAQGAAHVNENFDVRVGALRLATVYARLGR